ncbi:hypothetical protein [Bordetella sp. 15P40C-2]|nr:hypothetical protein [Bordetella sp. 15P40C-2]
MAAPIVQFSMGKRIVNDDICQLDAMREAMAQASMQYQAGGGK